MKTCKLCKIEKDESEFYFVKDRIHLNSYCKSCAKQNSKKCKRPEYIKMYSQLPYVKENAKIFRNSLEQKEKRAKRYQERYKGKYYNYFKLWSIQFPEKIKAVRMTQKIKVAKGYNKHHWNYNQEYWMDFIVLSRQEHTLVHKRTIYDQSVMMYRTMDGILLDTKEKYLNYINSLS